MKAFIGHSFAEKDEALVNKILTFLNQTAGVECTTGLKPQNKSVSEKVKKRIDDNEVFIGIFTIDREIKDLTCFQKILSKISRKQYVPPYTTSNWAIQESGYALGKDKELILLVEEGIYKFPELQGDKEVIRFNRNLLDNALLRLLTVIQDMKSGLMPRHQEVATQTSSMEKEEKEEDKERSKKNGFYEMVNAYDEGRITDAEKIYHDKVRGTLSEKDVPLWDAIVLRWKYCSGDADAIKQLNKLASDTKDSGVYKQLAYCYQFSKKEQDAIENFNRCIELSQDPSEKVDCVKYIALSHSRNKDFDRAFKILLEAVNEPSYLDKLDILYKALVNIAKDKEDDRLFILFSEKMLDVNPVDTQVRFNLAYKYSEKKKYDMAIYHYNQILKIYDDSTSLNNIAVAYANLEMDSKAVKYYKRAIDKNETLASANLAYKYLKEGFVDEAGEVLKKADELSKSDIKVHANVGYAKNELEEINKKEEKKEKEVFDSAQQLHKFILSHANAYALKISKKESQISGSWKTDKWGNMTFSFDSTKNTFEGDSTTQIESTLSGLGLGLFGTGLGQPVKKEYKTRKVQIRGLLCNSGGMYTIKVTDERPGATTLLLAGIDEVYSAQGLLIMNEEGTSIDIFEEDDKNNRFFGKWQKLP